MAAIPSPRRSFVVARRAVTLTFDPLRLVHANADENPAEQP